MSKRIRMFITGRTLPRPSKLREVHTRPMNNRGGSPPPSFLPLPVPTSLPSTTASTTKDEVVITGTVEMVGVEGGCKALRDNGNKTYELKGGDPNVLAVGARVTVRGKIRTDLMTICQIGPVLEVTSSQRA